MTVRLTPTIQALVDAKRAEILAEPNAHFPDAVAWAQDTGDEDTLPSGAPAKPKAKRGDGAKAKPKGGDETQVALPSEPSAESPAEPPADATEGG